LSDEPRMQASPSYAAGQLWRALESARSHPDREVRRRAEKKVGRWQAILSGMASGELTVGSRTPVVDTPAWVTLEVAHGGFATGRYLAEAALSEQETVLLESLAERPSGSTDRERLNLWFLSDAGLAMLRDALSSGRYRVEVPEEGAFLIVAWLVEKGHHEIALDLISELRPLMARLRFTPRFRSQPRPAGAVVHRQTAGEVAAALHQAEVDLQIQAMRDTLSVWHPLLDRLVALWAETVDGELPALVDGQVAGGWPCRVWPADWPARRAQWFADLRSATAQYPRSGRHHHPKSNFSRLRLALEAAGEGGRHLSARDVGWVRRALANTVTKHGAPGTERRAALRATQAAIASQPTHAELAHIIAGRLDRYPADGGIPLVDPLVAEIGPAEAADSRAVGASIPDHLVWKVTRALDAPIEDLVERGVISSGEVLARVLPQITSEVVAANLADPGLAGVYGQVYAAFRRRRSLLLLNLEHQVGFEELPWIGALAPFRTSSDSARRGAARTLRQATLLALTAFPQAVLPNPLVREMSALGTRAELTLPLVEEVAADIFTGRFTTKWRAAAAIASEVMAGTLYARYYDLPGAEFWAASPAVRGQRQRWFTRRRVKQTAEDFAALCAERAREAQGGDTGTSVAANGTVLEQSQILTTHNLAVLVATLDLGDQLVELAPGLADQTLRWIIKRQSQPWTEDPTTLQMIKNTAYGWRQAIFYLSFCSTGAQRDAIEQLRELLPAAGPAAGLEMAIDGLAHIVAGGRFTADGRISSGPGRRFLGWSVGRHWLMPATTR
jgi:hypothetical protein